MRRSRASGSKGRGAEYREEEEVLAERAAQTTMSPAALPR